MDSKSLISSYNSKQNSINVTYNIERINLSSKFRTSRGEKPYLLSELKEIAKKLGLPVNGSKVEIINALLKNHESIEKKN